MRKAILIVSLAALLSACASMAPKYERPAAPIPETWPTGAAYAPVVSDGAAATTVPWKTFFKAEKLQKVIDQALANSRDLRRTLANIESARAQYRIQRADLVPHLTADVDGTKGKGVSDSYSATAGLSAFEIDLFGKQRSLSNAAFESYLSTEEVARATRISLIAETASAYLAYAADNSLLSISKRTLESAQRSMDLTQKRLQSGVASRVDVRQAETVYQTARADVASLTATIAQDRNALELLAGSRIDDALLPNELPLESGWLAEVPAGVSSSVLLNRPDILEAEHNLKAANANIGAARAAFFPSLSLTANGGLASTALSSLFSGGANVWSVTSGLTLPIFSGGANVANLAYTKAQKELYVSEYELAVQTAFREAADALAVRGTIAESLDAQGALVEAASESYRLADARYSRGVDTFLNSLDSQRTLYGAEQSLVSTRLAALNNSVTLYRVLGGGLDP
jgi:multidrug efflux system outer membrane protein